MEVLFARPPPPAPRHRMPPLGFLGTLWRWQEVWPPGQVRVVVFSRRSHAVPAWGPVHLTPSNTDHQAPSVRPTHVLVYTHPVMNCGDQSIKDQSLTHRVARRRRARSGRIDLCIPSSALGKRGSLRDEKNGSAAPSERRWGEPAAVVVREVLFARPRGGGGSGCGGGLPRRTQNDVG